MPNRIRGEVELKASGRSYRLLLTLGALAEIEDAFGLASIDELSAKVKSAGSTGLVRLVEALMRGGGHAPEPGEVLNLDCDLATLVAAVGRAFAAGTADPLPFAGPTGSPSG